MLFTPCSRGQVNLLSNMVSSLAELVRERVLVVSQEALLLKPCSAPVEEPETRLFCKPLP